MVAMMSFHEKAQVSTISNWITLQLSLVVLQVHMHRSTWRWWNSLDSCTTDV